MAHKGTTEKSRRRARQRARVTATLTRRKFLTYTAAAGAATTIPLALPPWLKAWVADAGTVENPQGHERRTLFFNFAHEADAASSTYFLVAGAHRHRLRRVEENDLVLERERQTNTFLRGVPDAALTHVLEDAALPADAVMLTYVVKNPDTTAGTWAMSSMNTLIPTSAMTYAYKQARRLTPTGPLPLSAKRRLYGHRPAESLQDLIEERAVVDTTDQASTLIGLHPNMISGEPHSAAHIHTNYIQPNGATIALGQTIQGLGAAEPQQTNGQPNPSGWATLVPLTDDQTGQPIRNQNGNNRGLIQYMPDWNSAVDPLAAQGAITTAPAVYDDETLGADITGQTEEIIDENLGKLWARHDGFTTIDQSPVANGSVMDPGSVKWTITDKSVDQGFLVTADVQQQSDGSIQVTLTNNNWYLRWLGVWLQFLDNANPPNVIPVAQLPPNTIPGGNPTTSTTNELYGTMVPPEFTVLAIPAGAGTATLTFNMPPAASTVRILGSGLGTGSQDYPDTVAVGGAMTVLCNYGLETFFLAAGASTKFTPFQKIVILPIASALAQEIVTFINANWGDADTFARPDTWKKMGTTIIHAIANTGSSLLIRGLVTAMAAIITESTVEDAIPIAGQIMRVIAAIVGIADLIHTTVDIALSPWTYVNEMVFTHDVSVNILPESDTFPEVADYYKVTALFDNGGTPHVQTLDMPSGTVSTLPPVVFKDVPLGGQINLSTGFYSRSTDPSQNDWLAGKGTTGLVSNTVDQAPDITIEEFQVPIQSTTVYHHKQKTTLQADGTRVWTPTATPPSATQADIQCGGAGTLCDFRSITVRQGTSQQPGYVGYAWKAYSSGLSGCAGSDCAGGQGQFDQLANLNAAEDPQTGYANGACGFPDGVRLAYNLLTHSTSNFYLDSAAGVVRQVQLDQQPRFDPPCNQQAWGVLNLESTALLLHPSGKLVSINNVESRIETLKIPGAAMTDEDAKVHLLAQVHAGPGSRPGLLGSPSAAAVSPDGVILILENQNNRLQAFDLGGNPVQFFTKQQTPYFLSLDATASGDTVYLDLAVEFTGYLYVLSYTQSTNLYRMDIYHPGQSDTQPISTTQSFNAARLTVDFWRNVYTLNYELLRLPGGAVPAITEPSVSLWIPSAP